MNDILKIKIVKIIILLCSILGIIAFILVLTNYNKKFSKINKRSSTSIYKDKYQNTLYVFPLCGLCNQLLCMFSGIVFAKNNNMNYVIIPTVYSAFQCYFTDLFDNPEINYNKKSNEIKKLNLQLYSPAANAQYIKNIANDYSYSNKNILSIKNWIKPKTKSKSNDFGIISCRAFVDINSINYLYKTLKPNKIVNDLIKSFYKEGNNIGIHIRHTDNEKQFSKDEIINIIIDIYNKYKYYYTFFISSDNQFIKDAIIDIMKKDEIFYQSTNLTSEINKPSVDRSNLKGMQIATADLFALSYCKLLWGSNMKSTFFNCALNMGNAQKIIM